ncbi:MAG: ribosome-binding factor A [Clostridium sp.]|nr:MAG: ribosome-binding factor A [Clostridium sp.]
MGVSLKRLESLSLRELSIMIQSDSRLDNIRLLNITEIRITNDLSYMTVYYTVLDDKNKQKMADNLEALKPYIRREIAHKN